MMTLEAAEASRLGCRTLLERRTRPTAGGQHRLPPPASRPMETKSSGSHSPLSGGTSASTKRNGSSTGQCSGDLPDGAVNR